MMRALAISALAFAATVAAASSATVTEEQERAFLRFDAQSASDPEVSERGCSIPARPPLLNPENAPANANPDQAGSVLLSIYRRQNAERIVEQGECSCELYFAPWDDALDEMAGIYVSLHFNEWAEVRRENSRTTNALASQVRKICTESGVL